MRKQSLAVLGLLSVLCLGSPLQLQASKSKPFSSQEDADAYLTCHYNAACRYYNHKEWRRASMEFEKVIYFFPNSDAAADASYYLAICYFEMKEYDFANTEFSNYLKASNQPAFFEEAVQYKFCIAEHFKMGKKRRYFKMRYCPKWASGQDLALTIYDEVVAALPNNELAVQALYSKADLLKRMEEYRDAVEAYQTIIRRFPKNEIVPACYINIAESFYQQSRYEFQNPDLLALAELNARKFQEDFPRDERVAIAEDYVKRIKELYAKGLCDLGLFYERMTQPAAAAIYYQSSIEEFPDTAVSKFCRSRLICLGYKVNQEDEEALNCCEEVVECPPEDNTCPCPPCEDNAICTPQEEISLTDTPIQEQPVNAMPTESTPGNFDVAMLEAPPIHTIYPDQGMDRDMHMSGSVEEVTMNASMNPLFSGTFDEIPGSFEVQMPVEPPLTYTYTQEVSQEFAEDAMRQGVPVYAEEQVEEIPPTYIHYSLCKKRPQKCMPSSSCYEN